MNSTSERKLEVFIGATRRDLDDARRKVTEAVLEAGHIPCGMEIWNSDTTPVLDTIARHIGRCDVHVLIVGARYGEFVDPGLNEPDRISFTEWEFNESIRLQKPVIVFFLDDQEFAAARRDVIAADPTESERDHAFRRFRERLKNFQFSRSFEGSSAGIEKLGRLATSSLNDLVNSERLPVSAGWVRVDSEDAARARDIRQNHFLYRVIERLRQFRKLTTRVLEHRVEKEFAARFFWDVMAGQIRRKGYWHLFFESGSSIAYVSQQFEESVLAGCDDARNWNIRTNNVETLLQLLLHSDLRIQPFPASAPDPEDKYGAIFPREFRQVREPAPTKPRPLWSRENCDQAAKTTEQEAVDMIQVELRKLDSKVLVLATTSGLDLAHTIPDFRGPHVGSHPNMLFKRAIMTSGFPVVMFLDSKKFSDPFVPGKCFPILGPDQTWDSVRQSFPTAVCMGWDSAEFVDDEEFRGKMMEHKASLLALGFDPEYGQAMFPYRAGAAQDAPVRDCTCCVVMAANLRFKEIFPAG